MAKQLVSIRLSDTGRAILENLQTHLGATQASTVEMGLRELARKENLPIPNRETTPSTQSKPTEDAWRPIGKGDPGYYEGYDTPEDRADLDAQLRAADESIKAGRGIPGDVAMARHRERIAELKAGAPVA